MKYERKMKKDLINRLAILCCLFLCACTYRLDSVVTYVQNNTTTPYKDSVLVDLRDFVGVDFDTCYWLCGILPDWAIRDMINLPTYENWDVITDDEHRLICIKNEQVVFEEDFPTGRNFNIYFVDKNGWAATPLPPLFKGSRLADNYVELSPIPFEDVDSILAEMSYSKTLSSPRP